MDSSHNKKINYSTLHQDLKNGDNTTWMLFEKKFIEPIAKREWKNHLNGADNTNEWSDFKQEMSILIHVKLDDIFSKLRTVNENSLNAYLTTIIDKRAIDTFRRIQSRSFDNDSYEYYKRTEFPNTPEIEIQIEILTEFLYKNNNLGIESSKVDVWRLRYADGKSHKEVAEIMGFDEEDSKQICSRDIRKILKKKLNETFKRLMNNPDLNEEFINETFKRLMNNPYLNIVIIFLIKALCGVNSIIQWKI